MTDLFRSIEIPPQLSPNTECIFLATVVTLRSEGGFPRLAKDRSASAVEARARNTVEGLCPRAINQYIYSHNPI
jgi:hypothetical protein